MKQTNFEVIASLQKIQNHSSNGVLALTLPDDGFERLMYYKAPGKKEWYHKACEKFLS
jgi:hypothetical protein